MIRNIFIQSQIQTWEMAQSTNYVATKLRRLTCTTCSTPSVGHWVHLNHFHTEMNQAFYLDLFFPIHYETQ